jgi:hypothetical protein
VNLQHQALAAKWGGWIRHGPILSTALGSFEWMETNLIQNLTAGYSRLGVMSQCQIII